MAITPQAIKDQEFQIKFRGYDTVEVKAYLELIAEEFYELLEQVRQQFEEMDVIVAERDALQKKITILQREIVASRGSSEEIRSEFAERDSEVTKLRNELKKLKFKFDTLEEENQKKDESIARGEELMSKKDDSIFSEKKRSDKLSSRLDDLTLQNEELRKEELDFKSTLVAAQKFTDEVKRKAEAEAKELKGKTEAEVKELRRKTEEEVNQVKRKSEKEAKDVVENARGRAERLKQETYKELAHYPAQIDKLRKTKKKVKEELGDILKRSLDGLEIFSEGEGDKQKSKDYQELFRGTKQDPKKSEKSDGYESINMKFNLPEKNKPKVEEKFSMKDTMKNQGGGVT